MAENILCKLDATSGQSRNLLFFSWIDAELLLGLQACDPLNLLKRVAATTVSPPVSDSIREDSVASQCLDLFQGLDA